MNQSQGSEMRVAKYFTILVYPFRHSLSGKERAARLQKLEGCWRPWWSQLDHAALQCALDDTYFFLPYIRELLFPETAHLPEADAQNQVAEAERLAHLSPGALASLVRGDAVLRLTYNPGRLKALSTLQLEFERENFSAPFELRWVDATFFPQNVGFLLLKVQLKEDDLTVGRINDFLGYLRLVHPPRVGWELATLRPTDKEPSRTFKSRDLVDFLLQGLTDVSDSFAPTLEEFLVHVGKMTPEARYTATRLGQVYGQVFNLYTYACLAKSSSSGEEADAGGKQGPTFSLVGIESSREGTDLFASPVEQALYELATCTNTSDPNYIPHSSYLAGLLEQNVIAFWNNWQGMALHDNVVFLGAEESHFTREILAHNVESDYFHLYMFTLFQKTRLSMMFGELIRREVNLSQNLREARRLWDAFMMFENHYWFNEVTHKPLGTELYRRYQHGLSVLLLYEGNRSPS
jgi:hypothetical protein